MKKTVGRDFPPLLPAFEFSDDQSKRSMRMLFINLLRKKSGPLRQGTFAARTQDQGRSPTGRRGGEIRNRTRMPYRSDRNTLSYKGLDEQCDAETRFLAEPADNAMTPDRGRFLAVGRLKGRGIIEIVHLLSSSVVNAITNVDPQVMALDRLHPRLAVVRKDLEILEIPSGKVLRSFPLPSSPWQIDWDANENYLVSGCHDGRVYRWDLSRNNRAPVLMCPQIDAMFARYNSRGDLLCTTSADHTFRFWNPQTGRELLRSSGKKQSEGLTGVRFTRDDRRVALMDWDRISMFDLVGGREWRAFLAPHSRGRVSSRAHRNLLSRCRDGSVSALPVASTHV